MARAPKRRSRRSSSPPGDGPPDPTPAEPGGPETDPAGPAAEDLNTGGINTGGIDTGGMDTGLLITLIGLVAFLGYWAGQRPSPSPPAPASSSSRPTRPSRRRRDPEVAPVPPSSTDYALDQEAQQEHWIARGIVGTSRGELAKRFGPPVVASAGDYWQADTWYYPVDHSRRTGLAVRFQDHIAHEVEFIRPPPPPAARPLIAAAPPLTRPPRSTPPESPPG